MSNNIFHDTKKKKKNLERKASKKAGEDSQQEGVLVNLKIKLFFWSLRSVIRVRQSRGAFSLASVLNLTNDELEGRGHA